jgi:parvulin-like peptidyl-prolyl isomerase
MNKSTTKIYDKKHKVMLITNFCQVRQNIRMGFFLINISFFLLGNLLNADQKLAKDVLMATVNGKPVTLSDVRSDTIPEERKLPLLYSGKQLKEEIQKIRDKALRYIIDRKLVYEQFKKRGYKVPKQIIEKMLDKLAAKLSGGDRKLLESRARNSGVSLEELREQARERAATSLLLNARCYKPAYVTPKQIYDYYLNNQEEFQKPAEINLQVLYLKCDPANKTVATFAEKLRKLLVNANEETFSEYVKLHSQGPNKQSGGKVGWIGEDKLRPEFVKSLKGRNAGTIAGPLLTEEGFYFIRISERKEAETPSFEDVKKEINDKLTKRAEDKMYNKYISFLKRDAVIRIIKQKP